MRIAGTEPASVILSQTMQFKKMKSEDPKVPKQAETKLQFHSVLTRKTLMLSNATNQPKWTV